MAETFSGTLTPGQVTTVTLSGQADTVTVRADGTDSIWFTTDGTDPEENDPHLPRAAQGAATVTVDGEDDPTVVKLISSGAVAYTVSAATGGEPSTTEHSADTTGVHGIADTSALATSADVDAAIAALVDAAPGALDTLNELAAALGDDANFAATVTTALATKADAATVTTSLAAKADALVTANRQTGSYTLVLADAGKAVEMNVAGANNLTVPPNSSVAFSAGTIIEVMQYGAGQTTIVAGAGVTLRSPGGKLKVAAQYGAASLRKLATDEWAVEGDITT